MRVFSYRIGAAALEAGLGPYYLRQPGDAAWPPKARLYGGAVESPWPRLLALLLTAANLVLPVILLTILLIAAYLYCDDVVLADAAPALLQRVVITMSDLVLPAAWYTIHLTNRRYGAACAFAQLLAALAACLLVYLVNPAGLDGWIGALPSLTPRAVLAFILAFLAANFIAIAVFDGARGPRWWTAPLMASVAASAVFSLLYYPIAFAGTGAPFAQSALVHGGLFFSESVALLPPYWLLRPAMRPLPGLNGY